MSAQGQLARAVTAVASHGLVGSCVPAVERALTGREWDRFVAAAVAERLPGHLVAAIASGALPATPGQRDEAVELHTRALSHTLLLERLLLHATSWLREAGIDHRVVKGAALAHTVYTDPSLRTYGDVDLLVSSAATERVVAVLRAGGLSRTARMRWRPSSASADVALRWNDGLEVDLTDERQLFGGTVEPGRLFDDATEFTLGGRTLRTLAPEDLLLHACDETARGRGPRPAALRDVAELVLRAGVDADRLLATASTWPWGTAAVAQAIRWTWERFALADIVPLSVWACRYEPDDGERRALADLRTTRGRARAGHAVGALRRVLLWVPFLRSWADAVDARAVAPQTEGRP